MSKYLYLIKPRHKRHLKINYDLLFPNRFLVLFCLCSIMHLLEILLLLFLSPAIQEDKFGLKKKFLTGNLVYLHTCSRTFYLISHNWSVTPESGRGVKSLLSPNVEWVTVHPSSALTERMGHQAGSARNYQMKTFTE